MPIAPSSTKIFFCSIFSILVSRISLNVVRAHFQKHLVLVNPKNVYVELNNLVEQHSISLFVIGYPINLDGTNTDATALVDKFIKRINTCFPKIKISKVDERYTSKIAKKQIISSGVKKKKRKNKLLVDQMSAAIILQDYLNYA